MKCEIVQMPRQAGKSRFLAEKVCELQDAGFDPVVVIVPEASWVNHWFEMLFEVGIDPSRLIIEPACNARWMLTGHGRTMAVLVDDGDLIQDLPQILEHLRAYDDYTVTITTTRSLELS